MSYDLAVWAGPPPADHAAAAAEFERRYAWLGGAPVAPPSPALTPFLDDLLARFPDDGSDDSPWSTDRLREAQSGDAAYLTMVLSVTDDDLRVVHVLAARHGLVAFDPQTGRLVPPPPAVHAWTEGGDVVDDPSEDGLLLLLEGLRAEGEFLVAEQTADVSGQTYAQVLRTGTGWLVERRHGAEDTHEHALTDDLRAAHADLARTVLRLDRPDVLSWSPGYG